MLCETEELNDSILFIFGRVFEELKVHHDKEKTNFQADCEILRSRVAELEEQARKARLDSETLRTCCREKQDENEYMKL